MQANVYLYIYIYDIQLQNIEVNEALKYIYVFLNFCILKSYTYIYKQNIHQPISNIFLNFFLLY
jgi:hypothetical protein